MPPDLIFAALDEEDNDGGDHDDDDGERGDGDDDVAKTLSGVADPAGPAGAAAHHVLGDGVGERLGGYAL